MSLNAPTSSQERRTEVVYPDSDGQGMPDGDEQRDSMVDAIQTLERHFDAVPDVYISGNIFVYYREGDPRKCFAPDVLVARGIEKKKRNVYKVWEEDKAPDFLIEIASDTTWQSDLLKKPMLYHRLKVREYFLFDRTGERFPSGPMIAMRWDEEEYADIAPDAQGRFHSEVLGLDLTVEEGQVRFHDPRTGRRLPTLKEHAAEAEQHAAEAEQRVQQDAEQRQAAERRLADMEQRLQQLEREVRRLKDGAGA